MFKLWRVIQKDDKFCAHCGSKTEGHGENHSENNLEKKVSSMF